MRKFPCSQKTIDRKMSVLSKKFCEIRVDHGIQLVGIDLSYAEEIFKNFNAAIIQYLPLDEPPKSIDETISFIKNSMEQNAKGTDFVWAILHYEEFAGCCGLHAIPSKQPHFGLWIKEEKQGMGIGSKVVRYMLPWSVEHLNIDFIKYPVDQRNTRSIRLISAMNLKVYDHYTMGSQKKLRVDEYRYYKNKKSGM